MQGSRRRGRELALKLIYGLEDQPADLNHLLQEFWTHFRFKDDVLGEPIDPDDAKLPEDVRRFAEELVRGVAEAMPRLDGAIKECSTNWSLERMARVDLALLRIGAYELFYRPETPVNVVINEAVEIGKRYGTKETPAFVNGILDKLSRTARPA